MKQLFKDERAVSETLAHVMLFAVVIATITVTYATITPVIQTQATASQHAVVTSEFETLQETVDLVDTGVHDRTQTTVHLRNGALTTVNTTVNVTVAYQNGTTDTTIMESNAIRYENNAGTITYSLGGVYTQQNHVVQPPPVYVTSTQATINIVTIDTPDSSVDGVSGGAQTMYTTPGSSDTTATTHDRVDNVTVTVETEAGTGDAWRTALTNNGFTVDSSVTQNQSHVVVSAPVDRVSVRTSAVNVSVSQ